MFTQASATTVMPSSTAALPVSVRREQPQRRLQIRAHAVRPEKERTAAGGAVLIHGVLLTTTGQENLTDR